MDSKTTRGVDGRGREAGGLQRDGDGPDARRPGSMRDLCGIDIGEDP